MTVSYSEEKSLNFEEYPFTQSGYLLAGWSTDESGSGWIDCNVTFNSDMGFETLYAVWLKLPESGNYAIFNTAGAGTIADAVSNANDLYCVELTENFKMPTLQRRAVQGGKGSPAAASAAMDEPEADAGDEMMPAAVEVLLETGQASVSMLQRRLKLGYARAARIMDELEEKGIVGPFEGSKPRQMLITREQWQAMKDGTPLNPPVEEEIP